MGKETSNMSKTLVTIRVKLVEKKTEYVNKPLKSCSLFCGWTCEYVGCEKFNIYIMNYFNVFSILWNALEQGFI